MEYKTDKLRPTQPFLVLETQDFKQEIYLNQGISHFYTFRLEKTKEITTVPDSCVDMLIVCGSPSENKARILGKAIATAEGKVLGYRHKSHVLESLSFGSYVWKFRKEGNKNAWTCSDPAVYQAYTDSELCGFTFTDDAYIALFDLMKKAYDIHKWSCKNPRMPVLFISGAEDPCLGNVRKFAGAVHAMRRAGYLDVKGKLYPGMRHEILNEKGKERVWRDVVIYMKKKGF